MKTQNFVILLSICVVKCLAMSRSELEDFSNFLEMTSQLDLNVKSYGPDGEHDEDEPVSDHAWEESGKFEGDLILNERQRRLLVADIAEGLSRNGLQDSTKRWPNNEVIYYIQKEHFSSGQVQAIQDGIDDLAQASCVKFTPYKKGDRDAVVIQGSRRGCFSQVGYQGGYQVLNLSGRHPVGRGCFRHGTVVHELLHALGFYHMQSSPDRDDYIDVLWQNIVQPARHNFRKYNSFSVSDFGVGYDYESVLHYSRKAFSANGQDTLVPKQSGAEIGQRVGLSQKDIQKLNRMYCDADSNDSISNDDDDSIQKKSVTAKKRTKNKPFEGHGIGYHQGKAVAIKIRPTVELYRLPTLPKSHTFAYFSKTPQVMSTPVNQGRGSEKKTSQSRNIGEHIPSISTLITQSEIDVDDDRTEKANGIRTFTLASDGDNDVRLVNNERNNKDAPFPQVRNSNGSPDGTNGETNQHHPLFPSFRENSGINSYAYPADSYFNKDYTKYYNTRRQNEKHPEIVKIDKLYSSSKLLTQVPEYESAEDSEHMNFPIEFRDYLKNQSFGNDSRMKNNFEKTFIIAQHFNPDESKNSGIKSSSKYLSDGSSNNNNEKEDYTMLKFPLNEKWFTEGQDNRNHEKNYSAESYIYSPEHK